MKDASPAPLATLVPQIVRLQLFVLQESFQLDSKLHVLTVQ